MRKFFSKPGIYLIAGLIIILSKTLICQSVTNHIEKSFSQIDQLHEFEHDRGIIKAMIELEEFLYNSDLDAPEKNEFLWKLYGISLDVKKLESKLSLESDLLFKLYELEGVRNVRSSPSIAEKYLKKALTTLNNHKLSYRTYKWMAFAKSFLGKIDESIDYHEKSIDAIKLFFPIESKKRENQLLGNYMALVTDYLRIGDFKTAKKYSNLSLITSRKVNTDNAMYAAITIKLQELRLTDSPERVLELFREEENLVDALPSNGKAVLYQTLGDALFETEQYEEAISAMLKSQSYNIHDANKFNGQQTIGESYFQLQDFNSAIEYFDEMIDFFNKEGGNEGLKAEALYMRSKCFKEKKNIEQAKADAYKALQYKGDFDNWKIDYHALLAEIYVDLFDSSQHKAYLDSSIVYLTKTDSLINQLRTDRRFFEDEIRLGNRFYRAYASNLTTYSRLLEQDPKLLDQEHLFKYFENLKAYSLKKLLHTANAVNIGNIPDTILQVERQFKLELSALEEKIYESNSNELDSNNQVLQLELDSLKDEYYEFLSGVELDFPGYYRHQYENESVSLKQVQQLIKPDEVVIEYFISDKDIFQLVISSDSSKFLHNSIPDNWQNNVKLFRNHLIDPNSSIDSFEMLSQYFYDNILRKAISTLSPEVKRLRIVPDDVLNFIPFELLIDSIASKKDYKQLNYLQNRYIVSYIPSSSLLVDAFNASKASHEYNYIGFAPSYEHLKIDSLNSSHNQRNTLEDLPFARESVSKAVKLFGGSSIIGKNATVNRFVEQANEASIVHLAMHGVIDLEQPSFSNLLFYGTEEDHRLYTTEVFGLELASELAVLSACNTGIGKIINGDGIQNMARAFSFAGVKNTIMSLWSVPDVQTMTLNELFFKNVKDGDQLDSALRKAKIDYLEETSQLRAHPYYWAGLVANGTMESIELKANYSILLTIIGGVLLIVLLLIYLRRRLIS